jgi:colicin import membrane protein
MSARGRFGALIVPHAACSVQARPLSWPARPRRSRLASPSRHPRAAATLLAVLLLAGLVSAVAAPPDERERLATERRAVEARYAQARAACQTQFLVNDCLEAALTQRRHALEGLRQQQLLLDDAGRRERAAERRQQQLRAQGQASRASAPLSRRPRQGAVAGADGASVVPAAPGAGSVPADSAPSATAPVSRPAPPPATRTAPGAAGSEARHQRAFDRRQQAADEHRRAVEARNARQQAVHAPAASLPLPAASSAGATPH